MGIDENGHVIIADSVLKSASVWGKDGLVKHGRLTVDDILGSIKRDGNWTVNNTGSVDEKHFFYADSSDRGYLMVKMN